MAEKSYKVGEDIKGLKVDVKHDLGIVVIDLPPPPLKEGDKGEKVTLLQKALVKLERMPSSAATGTFDKPTARAVGAFQHDWGFKTTDGYDAETRLAMAHALNGEKPPTNVHEMPPTAPPKPKPVESDDGTIRGKICANAEWGIANTNSIYYAETRPIPDLHNPHHLPMTTDCSGFATLCYKWADAPDPNGNGYDGQGYTGTMMSHMKHIEKSKVQKGDLVIFGPGTGHHVCIVLEPGENALLASHGDNAGPLRITLDEEYGWQKDNGGAGITWLTVLGSDKAEPGGSGGGAKHPAPPAKHPAPPAKPTKPEGSSPSGGAPVKPPAEGKPKPPGDDAPPISEVEAGKAQIKPGQKGESVKDVQKKLDLTPSGHFDPATKEAVIAFQKEWGVSSKEYGSVDAHTYKLMTEHPVPPPGTTAAIKAAADKLDKMNLPYVYGGGHVTPAEPTGFENGYGPGLDCSAAVSWVLQHAKVKLDGHAVPTEASGPMESWFEPGHAGQAGVLLYASPNHVFMVIDGRVFSSNTSTRRSGGPHWYGQASEGVLNWEPEEPYTIRHVTGTK